MNGMQPAPHVPDPGAEAGKYIRLEIDVTELDHASSGCPDEPAVLPLDTRVTDGALRVDSEQPAWMKLSHAFMRNGPGSPLKQSGWRF
jgi:hypothetical protein